MDHGRGMWAVSRDCALGAESGHCLHLLVPVRHIPRLLVLQLLVSDQPELTLFRPVSVCPVVIQLTLQPGLWLWPLQLLMWRFIPDASCGERLIKDRWGRI